MSTVPSKYPNRLRELIKLSGYTIQDVAIETDIPLRTLFDYCAGRVPVPKNRLQTIAHLIGCSTDDLLLSSDSGAKRLIQSELVQRSIVDSTSWFSLKLIQITTIINQWKGLGLFYDELQTMIDQEIGLFDEYTDQHNKNDTSMISRRFALVTIAALPISFSFGKQPGPMTISASEEFLSQCAASIVACWHLMKGDGLVSVEEILEKYFPKLVTLIYHSSEYRKTAAKLATQVCLLRAILALHQLKFDTREKHCQDAIRYSHVTGDIRLQAASLMYLGYTYVYTRQPRKAIVKFQEALQYLSTQESLLTNDICMGLADAHAQCKTEKEALAALTIAQRFPTHPENDPSFLYADCNLAVLYVWEGRTYLELGRHYPDRRYHMKARQSLLRIEGVSNATKRNSTGNSIYQSRAAVGLNELEMFFDRWTEGMGGAITLGSKRRYNEGCEVYQEACEKWPNEKKIKSMAYDIQARVQKGE